MRWLPTAEDFRERLSAALATPDPLERFDSLRRLSQLDLDFLETLQLDNALTRTLGSAKPDLPSLRLGLLSSSTVEHLLPGIRLAALRRGLLVEAYLGAYGQYRQELLDPPPALAAFAPEVVVLSLSCGDVMAQVPLSAPPEDVQAAVEGVLRGLEGLWQRAKASFGATVVQQTFLDTSECIFGSYDRQVAGTPGRIVAWLNERVAEAAARERVALLDVAAASARDGIDAWFDVTRWLQGRLEISPRSASIYGELLVRVIGAARGLSRKCLVLDLDNTLWGGVVGDDGLDGIVLGQGDAVGEAHLALQKYVRALRERGVVLAVCSRNDELTARRVFQEHPEMALALEDIAVFVANWRDKPANLKLIASRLNLGLDSLVFLDDNPAERMRVREALPMVAVPELPPDPAHYVRCLADAGYFEAVSFTAEDGQRASQYAANADRALLQADAAGLDDFLRGLEMSLVAGNVGPSDVARVSQLINKTNQFKTTPGSYSASRVSELASDPANSFLQFRLHDRFGDNGLVSAMLLSPDPADETAQTIVTWVMSCRVFGRQLECEAMNVVVETAKERGARVLKAAYVPTDRNGVIRGLYEELGFRRMPEAPDDETTHWLLQLDDYAEQRTFIRRETTHGA